MFFWQRNSNFRFKLVPTPTMVISLPARPYGACVDLI